MGQYYKIVNFTKKEIIGGRHGKLTEFCYSGVDAVRELLFLLSDYWKGDEVYIVGDYAEYDSTYNKDEDIEIFDSYNDMEHILKDLYERFDIVEYEDRDEDTPNEKWSLYHLADTFSIIDHYSSISPFSRNLLAISLIFLKR